MTYAKHIIKKQVIKLEMAQGLDRVAIQNRVSGIYRNEIVPMLDKLLSEKSSSSTLIIDQLEINIGRIPATRLEQVLAEKIGKALQENLDNIKTSPKPETSNIIKPTTARQESHSDAELVIYFLQTGVFPWWAQETNYALLEKAIRFVIDQNSANFKNIFISLLQDNEAAKRLVYTFNTALLTQIAEQLTTVKLATILPQQKQLFNVFSNQLSAQLLQEYWWLSVYKTVIATSIRSENDLFEKVGSVFVSMAAQKSNHVNLLRFLKNDRTAAGILEKVTSFTNHHISSEIDNQALKKGVDMETKSPNEIDHLKANKGISSIHTPQPYTKPFIDLDKLYIQNAGLVLLWPFLQRFFQNMGLADDKAFIDETNAERACLLLQYLVAGSSEELFEAQLPLNKMLCGIPILQPVNTQWTISDEEKAISENFLLAIIQNGGTSWKNLSADGLRQAYLNREGIVSGRDGNWLLQVKRETYDILVDRLPWTVQVVKLPWMERLIVVEW